MYIILNIAFSLLMGWCCSQGAKRRGRSPSVWFASGAFFGILALIALYIIPARKQSIRPTPTLQQPPVIPTLTILSPLHADKLWYYLNEQKEQFGPMSFQALSRAWGEGVVQEHTFVWNEAMENWLPFKEVIVESGA